MKLTGYYSDKIRLLLRLAKKVKAGLFCGCSIDSFRILYSSLFGRYVAVKMIALLR